MVQVRSAVTFKEREALCFWKAAKASRHGEDKAMALDDLLTIGSLTEWALLKHRCAAALAAPGRAAL